MVRPDDGVYFGGLFSEYVGDVAFRRDCHDFRKRVGLGREVLWVLPNA